LKKLLVPSSKNAAHFYIPHLEHIPVSYQERGRTEHIVLQLENKLVLHVQS